MDMPSDVKKIYSEVRKVSNDSPRAACAILRLGLEKLLDHIYGNTESLNHNIGLLVNETNYGNEFQQALDSIRVTGDAILHPGVVNLKNAEKRETALAMFDFLNAVTKILISDPKFKQKYYQNIPKRQKDSIEKRDKKNKLSKV